MNRLSVALIVVCVVALSTPASAQSRGRKETASREPAPAARQQGQPSAQNDRRPPGWDRGRKEGWDEPTPPGIARQESARRLPIPMSPNGAPVQTGGAVPRNRREPIHKPAQ